MLKLTYQLKLYPKLGHHFKMKVIKPDNKNYTFPSNPPEKIKSYFYIIILQLPL